MKKKYSLLLIALLNFCWTQAQLIWSNVDSLYQPLPGSVQVFKSTTPLDGKPNIAFYVKLNLKDKHLLVDADTTFQRRLTPSQFYEKNKQPLVVVNCSFFSFQTQQNLSAVIKTGNPVSFNINSQTGKGKDSLLFWHFLGSAIGFSKQKRMDIAWLFSDSSQKRTLATQKPFQPVQDSIANYAIDFFQKKLFNVWPVETAVGGGPVLVQRSEIKITNQEEFKFTGKAIYDKHPRTAIGYLKNKELIILVIQGRFPATAEGATLLQTAQILKELGCIEAMNLDGGGSSCLLINGKETIQPSDKTGQRSVPAVLLIKQH